VFEDDFETIFQRVKHQLSKPYYCSKHTKQNCARILSGRVSLLLTLFFLRHKSHYRVIAEIFNVHHSTVCHTIYHVIPTLACSINTIKWPHNWNVDVFPVGIGGSQFAIDATAHYRNRVHPGQWLWYRGDKHAHFMAAQLVVALNGQILSVWFSKGHNNDQGLFNITFKETLEQSNVIGLGDRGYTHSLIVSPDDVEQKLQVIQSGQRAVVEIVIGMVKIWQFAAEKVSQPPELQVLGLKVIYELTNMLLMQFP